ncbi:MAG: hypothetical protein QM767_16590 [Anaeromyxobacter sp.]
MPPFFTVLLAAVLPAILTLVALFPLYAVGRYVLLRRYGAGPALTRFKRWTVGVGLGAGLFAYAAIITGVFFPAAVPALSRFIAKGGLAAVTPLILLDGVLVAVLHPDRALATRERSQRAGAGEPGAAA